MLELTRPATPEVPDDKVDQVPIFTLEDENGEKKTYSIPDRVRAELSKQALHVARTQGMGIAEDWIAEQIFGREAWEALINYPGITDVQINAALAAGRAVVFGEVKPGPKANGRRQPAKRAASTSKRSTG